VFTKAGQTQKHCIFEAPVLLDHRAQAWTCPPAMLQTVAESLLRRHLIVIRLLQVAGVAGDKVHGAADQEPPEVCWLWP